jgi:large subunit ribosomal protein L24
MPKPKNKQQKLHVKKGDEVVVLSGRDRGVRGKVLRVLRSKGTAIVERINLVKKHTKPNPQRQIQGGVLEREAPISVAKLQVICPESGKPTRIGRRRLEDGRSVRVAKKSGATLN